MENMQQIQSENIDKIVEALAIAQSKIKMASEDSTNPHFRSKYASYESLRLACREPLSSNHLVISHHLLLSSEGKRIMCTQISHASGQWMRSFLMLPAEKETPQGVGSAITYSKRYTLSSLLALGSGDDDDDGEAAEKPFRTQLISASQADELNKLTSDDEQYRKNLLNFFQIESFEELPADKLVVAMRSIQKRKSIKGEF